MEKFIYLLVSTVVITDHDDKVIDENNEIMGAFSSEESAKKYIYDTLGWNISQDPEGNDLKNSWRPQMNRVLSNHYVYVNCKIIKRKLQS